MIKTGVPSEAHNPKMGFHLCLTVKWAHNPPHVGISYAKDNERQQLNAFSAPSLDARNFWEDPEMLPIKLHSGYPMSSHQSLVLCYCVSPMECEPCVDIDVSFCHIVFHFDLLFLHKEYFTPTVFPRQSLITKMK